MQQGGITSYRASNVHRKLKEEKVRTLA